MFDEHQLIGFDEYWDIYDTQALQEPVPQVVIGRETEEVPIFYPVRHPIFVEIPVVVEHRYKHIYPRGHKEERAGEKPGSKKLPFALLALLAFACVAGVALLMGAFPAKQHATSTTTSIPAGSGDYTVTAPNELSPDQVNAILRYYGSPYVGEGQDIYDLGQQYGIDDIYFLADYRKESSFGNSTLASAPYYNPTGMECSDLAEGCTGADGNGRNWGTWTSPRNGYEAWFKQISGRYVSGAIDGGYRLTTIWLIACGPNGTGMYDGGSGCNQYAADIERWVDTWRRGKM